MKNYTILDRTEKGNDGKNYRLGKCSCCHAILKLAGMGGHLYYKHGMKRE